MTCQACADFEADATTAAYTSGCRGCDARALAGTVIFERVMATQKMTDEWQDLIARLTPSKPEAAALHQATKRAYLRRRAAEMGTAG